MDPLTSKLNLDQGAVLLARELARRAGEPVTQLALTHTTVSIERAVLRLGGLDGADSGGMPWVNRLTDAVRASVGLEHGVALPVWDALHAGGYPDLHALAEAAAAGKVGFRLPVGRDAVAARELAVRSISAGVSALDRQRARRAQLTDDLADPPFPWVYLTVGGGDADQAVAQAQAAARDGADVIAVIRSTGQPLLDYVPAGVAGPGRPGSYATGESFRRLRAALDQTSRELGRYVRLTSYASGLCMPEIAALAGLERLDMMLSDCMHGIIVRDINPLRTFIDQRFSRAIGARAGIVVSPGEESFIAPAPTAFPARAALPSRSRLRRLRRGRRRQTRLPRSSRRSCSTSTSAARRVSRPGSSGSGTGSNSTPPGPIPSSSSWRRRSWSASSSPARR